VAEIALHDYAAHLVLKPDHTVNFAALAGGGTETGAATTAAATALQRRPPRRPHQAPAVRIGAVVLRNGTITVTDRSIQPASAPA